MEERKFLLELEKRAEEQEKLIKGTKAAALFVYLSLWFGKHPWRIIIPLSIILTFLLRLVIGETYYNLILRIFGGA